jgi:CheY-like chemotaxis protein
LITHLLRGEAGMLGGLDFEVREATNGLEVLELASSTHPDLILIDVMMPGMDGFEAMRAIRRLEMLKATPIIAVSASVGTDDQARGLAAGANAFLSKPVNQEHLFREIGRLLELCWIYQRDAGADRDTGQPIVAPAGAELLRLYNAAKAGNMRVIRELADDLPAGNPNFGAFAVRLRALADAYNSKALVAFVGSYVDEKLGVGV